MDTAVALVESYLHTNGYLTAVEYPIVQEVEGGGYRAITDIDILAIRMPGAGMIVPPVDAHQTAEAPRLFDPDPRLIDADADDVTDVIIGEVKEGRAELNRGARQHATMIAALRRISYIKPDRANRIAKELIERGHVRIKDRNIRIRVIAFGGRRSDREPSHTHVILLRECLDFLVGIGHEYAAVRGSAQVKNPIVNLMTILGKAGYLSTTPQRTPWDADRKESS
ncbi:MAG: hypothetical protein AAF432_00190 [Planctomycetota bacterium]